MKKNVLFFGSTYRPGHQELLESYFLILSEEFNISFFLDDEYYRNSGFFSGKNCFPAQSIMVEPIRDSIILIVSPGKLNLRVSSHLKKHLNTIVYIFHEPYSSFLQYYFKWGGGLKNLIKAWGLTVFNGKPLVRKIDLAILPSQRAYSLFRRNFGLSKPAIMIPLMYGLPRTEPSSMNRSFFAYIGNADKSKNFDLFVEYILSTKNNPLRFLIATSTSLSDSLLNKLRNNLGEKLVVVQGHRMSTEEIEMHYRSAAVLWMFYKDSTQSGVLPISYKCGTPVLASRVEGITQNVIDNHTGRILGRFSVEEIDRNVNQITENQNFYCQNAWEYFRKNYYFVNYKEMLLDCFKNL